MSIAQYEENTRALFDAFRRNYGMISIKITIAWYSEAFCNKESRKEINNWCGPLQEDIYFKFMMNRAAISSQVDSLLIAMRYDFDKLLQPDSIFMRKHVAELFTNQYGVIKWPKQFVIICDLCIDTSHNTPISQHALRVYMMDLDISRSIYISRLHLRMPDQYLLPTITDGMARYLRGHIKSRM